MINRKKIKKKEILSQITNELNENEQTIYKGFKIVKSYGEFHKFYYTIINKKTNTHVHSQSLKDTKNICDYAYNLISGITPNNNVSTPVRFKAEKLALRLGGYSCQIGKTLQH